MKTTAKYNSIAFIKSQIYRSVDAKSAHMHSDDVVDRLKLANERDEAWMEAIEVATEILSKEGFECSSTEDHGNSMTVNWEKE